MEKLIAALDFNAEEEKARQRLTDASGAGPAHQRGSDYIPPSFPLPPTAVFRAALGGPDWEH